MIPATQLDLPLAKKRFGQNFLRDDAVIARIVALIAPQADDAMVEIGPGPGALTRALMPKLKALTAIELDTEIIPYLAKNLGDDYPRLTVHREDALRFDFGQLMPSADKIRVVGNLPYNISSPLMFHLLQWAPQIADMHFMLQKEVVDRLCAEPDTDDYGRLTVAVAARAEAKKLLHVAPGSFVPAPKVDSAIVRLTPRPAPFALHSLARYDRIVTAAFAQRRKTLSNALKGVLSPDAMHAHGIDPQLRAEVLSPEDFGRLSLIAE